MILELKQPSIFTYGKVGKSIEHLCRGLLRSIEDIPMVNRSVSHQTQRCFAKPLPIDNILVHRVGLELLLRPKVEDLNCAALSPEGDDVLSPMHNSIVGVNGPAHNFIVIFQVDDEDLWLVLLIELLTDADVVIGFEGLSRSFPS